MGVSILTASRFIFSMYDFVRNYRTTHVGNEMHLKILI